MIDFCFDILIYIPFERNAILFGIHNESPDSVNNLILLVAKHYIWANKFKEPHTPLNINAFKNYLIQKIEERKKVAEFLNKFDDVDEWNSLLLLL